MRWGGREGYEGGVEGSVWLVWMGFRWYRRFLGLVVQLDGVTDGRGGCSWTGGIVFESGGAIFCGLRCWVVVVRQFE